MSEVRQHNKYATTGTIGQDMPEAKTGAAGKPSDQVSKTNLIDGSGSPNGNTLEPGAKRDGKSPW